MKLRWHDMVSKEDIKKLDTHSWKLIADAEFKDMKCKKCGYVVWQADYYNNLYYAYTFGGAKILTCDESVICQVLL
jgi:hypothetical protein